MSTSLFYKCSFRLVEFIIIWKVDKLDKCLSRYERIITNLFFFFFCTVYIDSLKNILIDKVTKILAWSSLTVFHKNKSSS